jgi:carboxyl-terminal processing protease
MQDYERAVIVGSSKKTHGKGTVQAIIDRLGARAGIPINKIGELGAIKITIQMFFRVNGGSTQFKGVVPDIILPDQFEYFESGEESLDYAIPYQKVKAVKYKKWDKDLNLDKLKSASEKRVAKNKLFKKIQESVEFYTKRKEDTERTLNLKEMIAFKEETKKKAEEFKVEEAIGSFTVETDSKKRDEVEEERAKEFKEGLAKDPVIEESLNIMSDMIKNS